MEREPKPILREEWERQDAEYQRWHAEWERQLPEGAFDLEKLGSDRLAVLFEALGDLAAPSDEMEEAKEIAGRASAPGSGRMADELMQILGKEIKRVVEQDPERALRLFWRLLEKDDYWPKLEALEYVAKPFTQQQAGNWDSEARAHFFHKLAELLLDDDGLVREAADMTLADAEIKSEWINEETAAILNEHAGEWWS